MSALEPEGPGEAGEGGQGGPKENGEVFPGAGLAFLVHVEGGTQFKHE